MSDLVSRVLAAIEETERTVHEAGPAVVAWATYRDARGQMLYTSPVAQHGDVWVTAGAETEPTSVLPVYDPAAVLRRTQADKRVLERHTPFLLTRKRLECAYCAEASPCADLRDLADRYGISVEEETTQ